jgi:hypothetical protein
MGSEGIQFLILLLLLLLVGIATTRQMGAGTLVASWIVLSALTMWCEYIVAFAGVHALLFMVGREAAAVGFVLATAVLVGTPIGWAVYLRRRAHHVHAHG